MANHVRDPHLLPIFAIDGDPTQDTLNVPANEFCIDAPRRGILSKVDLYLPPAGLLPPGAIVAEARAKQSNATRARAYRK